MLTSAHAVAGVAPAHPVTMKVQRPLMQPHAISGFADAVTPGVPDEQARDPLPTGFTGDVSYQAIPSADNFYLPTHSGPYYRVYLFWVLLGRAIEEIFQAW